MSSGGPTTTPASRECRRWRLWLSPASRASGRSCTFPAATATGLRCSRRSWAPPRSAPRECCACKGDPVAGVDHVADMTATELIAGAPGWSVPHSLAVGAVVNPFAEDLDRELRLLQRKVAAGATFVQSQMVFDLPRLEAFLARGEDMLAGVRVYASVALLRSERMA